MFSVRHFLVATTTVLLLVSASQSYGGLVGYWTGNGNALDSAGGNNGTLENGATYGTGMVGQAFSLDGSNDYVALPNATSNLVSNDAGTIAAWVNPSAVGDNDIILAFGSGGDGQGIGLGIFGALGGIRVYHHTGEYDWQTSTPVAAGTWTLLAYTWNAATEKIYVNGDFNVSRARGAFSYHPGAARIGHGFWGDPANLFPGLIDELRVYDHALSQSEVRALMTVPEPSSLSVALLGLGGVAIVRRCRRVLLLP